MHGMQIFRSNNQIDLLAIIYSICVIVSLSLSIYISGKIFQSFGVICFLCFNIIWIVLFMVLNEIVSRKCLYKRIPPIKKAILITGCDRGFGYEFAKRLSDAGFQVFAGCLNPFREKALEINSHTGIYCLKMDVTKLEEIQLALDYIMKHLQGNELWAVVNNAGISKGSDIESTSMRKIEEVLDVNLMGTIRVTKTFLPLLRASKGRVINVASAAGRLTLPGFLPYSVSKNAVITFSDGLRLEMKRHDVHVISIEPWIYRTKLADSSAIEKEIEREHQSCLSSTQSMKDENHVKLMKEAAKSIFSWGVSSNLDEVVDVVYDAVTLQFPSYRYSPGKFYLNMFMWFLYFIPKPVADFALCKFIFRR